MSWKDLVVVIVIGPITVGFRLTALIMDKCLYSRSTWYQCNGTTHENKMEWKEKNDSDDDDDDDDDDDVNEKK